MPTNYTCEVDQNEWVHCFREDGTQVFEDESDWDCEVMGNQLCAPSEEPIVAMPATNPIVLNETELARTGISSGSVICLALLLILIGVFLKATQD